MPRDSDLALLGEALRDLGGPLMDFCRKRSKDPEKWDGVLRLVLRGENPYPEKLDAKVATPELFAFVKGVELPERAEFRPADHFRVTPGSDREMADVVIGYIDPDFQSLLDRADAEPAKEAQTLSIRRTLRVATLGQMLVSLPQQAEKVALGGVWQMIKKQGRGQEGDLLVDGGANLFFIGRTVLDCRWGPANRYWYFNIRPVSHSCGWGAGRLFISCDSGS